MAAAAEAQAAPGAAPGDVRADAPATACPFCGARGAGVLCLDCGRDKTAARRVCARCQANTPLADPVCQACGQRQVSEMRWKIPLIVAMFAAAITLAVVLQLG